MIEDNRMHETLEVCFTEVAIVIVPDIQSIGGLAKYGPRPRKVRNMQIMNDRVRRVFQTAPEIYGIILNHCPFNACKRCHKVMGVSHRSVVSYLKYE
eukprot:4866130-Amphidinium_carterae.2